MQQTLKEIIKENKSYITTGKVWFAYTDLQVEVARLREDYREGITVNITDLTSEQLNKKYQYNIGNAHGWWIEDGDLCIAE